MLLITSALLTLHIVGILGRSVENPEAAVALEKVADDGFEFSKAFYGVSTKAVPGNLICSPVSALSVLSMLAYGARGSTETAMKSSLHFNADENVQKDGLRSLVNELNNSPGVELRLANKIFVGNSVNIKSDYQQAIEDIFKSSVQKVDYSKAAEAASTINSWCEAQTNSKIKDIVSADSFSSATLAVLVNAAYFKGKWKHAFDKEDTRDEPFHFEDGTTKNVPTMQIKEYYNYGLFEDVNAKFVELPYEGEQVSMFIILPNDVNGLSNLQQNFAQLNLKRLLTGGTQNEVRLSLPRFEIESQIDLKQPLTDLGMGQLFTNPDFSGMVDVPAKVDKALQKAYIKVDETGSEAAAATVIQMVTYSLVIGPEPIQFKVDHPFHYAIVKRVGEKKDSGIVLFQGHYKGDK